MNSWRAANSAEPLQGLYAGNPKRAALNPTAEQLLQAFTDITLCSVTDDQHTTHQVTPLSALQRRILGLLNIPETVYTSLVQLPLAVHRKNEQNYRSCTPQGQNLASLEFCRNLLYDPWQQYAACVLNVYSCCISRKDSRRWFPKREASYA